MYPAIPPQSAHPSTMALCSHQGAGTTGSGDERAIAEHLSPGFRAHPCRMPMGPEQSATQHYEFRDPPDLSGQATLQARAPWMCNHPSSGTPLCHMNHPPPSHFPCRTTLPFLRLHGHWHNLQYPAPLPGGTGRSRRWRSWCDSKVCPPNKGRRWRTLPAPWPS